MKVIVIEQFGGDEVFLEKELPLPKPARNEVRIKIKTTGFNPVDCKIRAGEFGSAQFPLVLGAECSGVVDAVGDKYHDLAVGDEVWAFVFGPSSNGTYAEYVCLPIQFVAKKPKNLSFDEAAAIPLTYLTAFEALIAKGAFQKERPIFIAGGSGGVGSAAISLLKSYQGGPIFTTVGSQESLNYLVETFGLPSENILNYQGLTLKQMVNQCLLMNQKEPFYFAFDCVGGLMKELCFAIVQVDGHVATILPEDDKFPIIPWGRESPAFQKSLSVHVVFLGAAAFYGSERSWSAYGSQLNHLASLFEKEGLLKPKIEKIGSFSAETVQRAHRQIESRHTKGKLIMTVSDSN